MMFGVAMAEGVVVLSKGGVWVEKGQPLLYMLNFPQKGNPYRLKSAAKEIGERGVCHEAREKRRLPTGHPATPTRRQDRRRKIRR